MPLFPSFSFKKKPKDKVVDEKQVNSLLQESLTGYMKKEDLDKYLRNIERDKEKQRIWDSLSTQNKIKLLRYIARKRGEKNGKT